MRPSIRIEGTDAIVRNLRAMGKALPADVLVPIISEELGPMADDMRAHAARASGQLADSVTVGQQLSPAQAAAVVPIAEVEVYAGPGPLPQAISEEFGNFRQDARPFIRPSFDGNVDKAVKNVATRGVDAILAAGEG